jgi:hypothetical protein
MIADLALALDLRRAFYLRQAADHSTDRRWP